MIITLPGHIVIWLECDIVILILVLQIGGIQSHAYMVIKILSSSASFKGVSYNTDKVDNGKGELMKVSGFGMHQALETIRPEDLKNYLRMQSALNKRVKQPQLHAVISAQGRSHTKEALTEIAESWMKSMGYGNQPYLVVFHKDTGNNHVHIVSTRVARSGRKISSGFENIRAIDSLNKIMGIDEKHSAEQDIKNALTYHFTTKAQFMMILESQGYVLTGSGGNLEVIKFGVKQEEISLQQIEERIEKSRADDTRATQLRAIFNKYAKLYDTRLKPVTISTPGGYTQKPNGYTSEFAEFLRAKMGIVLIFHAKDDKPPYGYSVIDHSGKAVFKGSEIVALKDLLQIQAQAKPYVKDKRSFAQKGNHETRSYYSAILKAALFNYPDLEQGLQHQGLTIVKTGNQFTMVDKAVQVNIPVKQLLDEKAFNYMLEQFNGFTETDIRHDSIRSISISDDVDDEAIHGRRRRKNTRSNTR